MKRLLLLLWLLVPGLSPAARAELISTQQEIQIGQQAAAEFEQQYGVVSDPRYTERLGRIGQQLAQQSGRDIAYRFRVANMDQFNALAFPGGFVYATRGLMDALPDEELAFVLGHEIAHVAKRHSVRQLEKELYTQAGLLAIVGVLSNGRIDRDSATLVQLANAVISSQYSQADERDADRVGTDIMARAGYDPAFSVTALQILAEHSGNDTPGFLNTIVGSHPLPQERLTAAVALVPTIGYTSPGSSAPGPIVTTPPPRPAKTYGSGRYDPVWDKDLQTAVRLAATGLKEDPRLVQAARQMIGAPQTEQIGPRGALMAFTLPAGSTSAQAESQLLGQALPRATSRHRYGTYGLSVGRTADGTRQVVLMLK
ncbi:MAG: M48 family metalloprotease [Armatimonadetes bacterium]|nr:M48 family metalloprotease [Armatimonadota bacterium]